MQVLINGNNVPVDFTGVIYADSGKLNWAAAKDGKLLRRKDLKVRWFASKDAAAKALQEG